MPCRVWVREALQNGLPLHVFIGMGNNVGENQKR